jgi:NAD(P)-dependent dehydrogenase (short-subunit alcohol dehydrogenase family)
VKKIEDDGGKARSFELDARKEDQVAAFFARVEREVGPVEVAVFNVGGNIRFPIVETTWQKYYKSWEQCAGAGFLVGREAARAMLPRGRGTILFTGATASLRGGSGFAAFAGGKHALRALAQSMARELGPQGIHVAHVVVDGMIDTELTAQRVDDPEAKRRGQAILDPEHIAENYWHLHCQGRCNNPAARLGACAARPMPCASPAGSSSPACSPSCRSC